MNYNKTIIYCDKYNIERYTEVGKPLTYNELKNVVNDHTNNKNINYHKKTKVLNSILKTILMNLFSRKRCIILLETKIIKLK